MLRLRSLFVSTLAVLAFGCSAQDSQEPATEEGALEQGTVNASDALSACPALEESSLTAGAVSDQPVAVKQSYRLYTAPGQSMVVQTNRAWASTSYSLRFYRDAQGKSKFQLRIGTFAGIAPNIDGDVKEMVVSGTVSLKSDKSSGELVVTSRRDALRAIVGADVTKIPFSGLDCSGGSGATLELSLLTLEKATEETVEIKETVSGETVRVTPKVKWNKKADKAALPFVLTLG